MTRQLHIEVRAGGRRERIALSLNGKAPTLAEVLRAHSLPVNTRCGQKGVCDGCLVELRRGSVTTADAHQGPTEMVRSCELRLTGQVEDFTVTIPDRSLLSLEPQVLTDFRLNIPAAVDPLEPQYTGRFAIAIDIGTTTVVAALVNRADGSMPARLSDFNRQMHLADDVLSRINLCLTDSTMVARFQSSLVVDTLRPLVEKLLAEAEAEAQDIACVVMAGNATMLHLLVGENPGSMGVAPFTPQFLDHRRTDAQAIGLMDVATPVHLLPGAAAYVGADITGGVLASGLCYDDGPSLLVDAGTNGEIVLRHDGRLWGCATAAGPAFEGAGLMSGMRAASGAISHLWFADEAPHALKVETIGGGKSVGICGSAYIDWLAEARRVGVLSHTGRFDPEAAQRRGLRVEEDDDRGRFIRLTRSLGGEAVVISEYDVARLLQAKAAIAAGILTLLERLSLKPADVRRLYLAGGFGMHMNLSRAIACGLIPGFESPQVQLIGNSALGGAYLAAVDHHTLEEMKRIASQIQIVELNLDPGFEDRYIEQLALPEPKEMPPWR